MKNIVAIFTLSLIIASCGGDEGLTFNEQLAVDISQIDSYLETNGINAEVHESGIRFVETQIGGGATPGINQVAIVKYDFNVLGSDQIAGQSQWGDSFTLNASLMSALFTMLQEMQEGGQMTIYAPSGYCFGRSSAANVPANSNLVFNLELVSVVTNVEEQFEADTTIIETYLDANEINALVDDSGIRYVVLSEGDGESPEVTDLVTVNYIGSLLDGAVFDQGAEVEFELDNLIEAWQIMIPTMKPGGSINIYAPSRLCYGPGGNNSIPPNTILTFEIELITVQND